MHQVMNILSNLSRMTMHHKPLAKWKDFSVLSVKTFRVIQKWYQILNKEYVCEWQKWFIKWRKIICVYFFGILNLSCFFGILNKFVYFASHHLLSFKMHAHVQVVNN